MVKIKLIEYGCEVTINKGKINCEDNLTLSILENLKIDLQEFEEGYSIDQDLELAEYIVAKLNGEIISIDEFKYVFNEMEIY